MGFAHSLRKPRSTRKHRSKIQPIYRVSCRVFTASSRMGLLLIKPAELLLFYSGAETYYLLRTGPPTTTSDPTISTESTPKA